jgi:hypothetical protein
MLRLALEAAGIAVVLALAGSAAVAENIVFPDEAGLVDVTRAPYHLKGDGRTDNTAALRKAFLEQRGLNRTLYFPNGTYLFRDRINVSGDAPSRPHSMDRFLNIQGQSQAGVILKLQDNAPGYDDPANARTFLSLYEGQSTGDVMHSYVRNITVEIGAGNPGAAAFRFMTNNTGAMYDVTIRSADPARAGAIGLDLRQSQNGPGLLKRITVDGFDHGVQTANTFSLVFEHIALTNQRKAAFQAGNSRLTIRGLRSRNRVPALVGSKHTHLTLIEADLAGGAAEAAIVLAGPKVVLRDIQAAGYAHAVKASDGSFADGPIDEWYEGEGRALFGARPRTLRLPIEETPAVPWETDLSKWVRIEPGRDTAQKAFDAAAARGATTVYFPKILEGKGEGRFRLTRPIRVHGSVNRILGMENVIDVADPDGSFAQGKALFTFEGLTSDALVVERFFLLGGWKCPPSVHMFDNRSGRTIVIQNVNHAGIHKKPCAGGRWFLEDVSPSRQGTLSIGKGERCWARQLNPESPRTDMVDVDGGQLWVLGLKTEGRARHIVARGGARVELLGGVSYQSWKNQPLDPPMFTVVDSDASFTFGFYHWNQPFTTIVEETRGGETKRLPRTGLVNYHLPAYRAGPGER